MSAGVFFESIIQSSFPVSNHISASGRWRKSISLAAGLTLLSLSLTISAQMVAAPPLQVLPNQMAAIVNGQSARFLGALPDSQKIELSIVLPLRNQDQLDQLLARLYDPASSDYHKFLSVEEFTDQFGPTEADYQEVVDFATANGFTVTGPSKNRLVVAVEGTVAQVNSTFHVRMGAYQHPTENRSFFSPDREPSVALSTPIAHIDGMDSFSLPHAMYVLPDTNMPMANINGSGPGGSYLGSDMRAAYYGGSVLTGLNQTVALVEFGGYLTSDVGLNFSGAGQTYDVPVQNILVGSATNTVYGEDAEQVLDIVQAIGMAPGLNAVEVYIGDPTSAASSAAVLNQIATDNTAKQIGCSWGWIPGSIPAQEAILQEMAAQGQTFFAASGDSGAFQASISPFFYPAESQYVTAVGGTHLTTAAAAGAWSSEVAWNSGGLGSGGGISPDSIPIPSWQSGLATSTNGGSNTLRNVPDVAAEADFDNYVCNLGSCNDSGSGTSFATPRWAGFMALVNQQAVEAGNAPLGGIGFIDASLRQIGTGSSYGTDLHDIQSGNNDTDNQTVWFSSVPGYDLVTGWGSPAGQPLIDDLAGKAVPGFWISSSNGMVSVLQGANATTTISVTDADGFSGNVILAVTSNLPSGVTASFNPSSTSSSSVLTLNASNAAVQGSYAVTITGSSGTTTESTTIELVIHGPSFTLSPSAYSLTVNQGASANSTITVNALYGFTGSVNLQVSGLPSGLTASFGANPTSTTSVLTLTASSTAAPWLGYITVTGTSGSLTASTQIYVNLIAPGFTVSTSGSLSMGQGTTSSTFVDISGSNGFTGNVTLSVSGLPSGVTAFFTPNPITSSGELTIIASNSAAVGSATLTVTGTSGPITATAIITLTVNAPGFTLYSGGSASLGQGGSALAYIYVNDLYGFTGAITLSASGLPAGVTASFATNPTTSFSQLTFLASSSAAPGTYTVTVTGTAGSINASTTVSLTVGAPGFTISAPSSDTLSQSGTESTYVDVNDLYGFNGSVTFSASGLPAGVTASFGTNPTTYSSAMTLTASFSAAVGNYTVTITGTSGSISKTTTMTLSIVAPSMQISASSVTLGIGTSATTYVYVYGNNGFAGNVTLSMSGLPSGITASFSPNPVSLTGYSSSSQLTLTASASVAGGSYTATLTGTSGSVTASTSVTITTATPSFTLSSSSGLTIGQGGSGSSYVYVSGTNGFNGNVTLSLSGLPTGVSAAFGTNPTTYSSGITFSATDVAPTGTYPVTITGTSGSIVATTTVSLTVATPSFTLSPGQSTYSINQGASFQSYLYLNGTNGFSGNVTLSASGLPSGVTLSFGTNPTTYYSSMTFMASSAATPGTSTVTITGTSGSLTASTTVTVTVNAPSFTLTPAPGSITLLPGGSDKSSVAVNALNGFSGSASFSIAGLPSGVTSSWNPVSSATGSVLTLTAASSAQPITATATITGTSGALTASVQLPITIRSPATFSTTALAITAAGSSVTTAAWGTPVTLAASVTSGGSPVTSGLVNFCDGTASYCGDIHLLGSAQLNSMGTASMNLLPLPGSHTYKAVFAGTAAFGGSSSPAGSLQVAGAYPSATSLTSSGTAGNYTLNATVYGAGPQAPTGPVSFVDTSSGNSTLGSANLLAGTPALTWSQLSSAPAGPYPGAIVTADFNGDGISDVAILDAQNNAVIIELGNAAGTFTTSALSPQTSSYPVAIAVADFNGDGIPDLAVVTSAGTVNIFLGNGDGTFNTVSTSASSGANSSAIVAGDFNGDGIPDLAIDDTTNNRLVILLGKGDGTFTISTSYPATGSSPVGMAVADLNGDGNLDIAVGDYGGTLTVLLGNGDGTFSGVPNTLSLGTDPASIVVADFNADGKPDLAIGSYYSSSLSILLGNGDGTFTAAASPSVNYYSSAVVPIDVNQDGIVDLVVPSSSYAAASVLLGNGNGTFTPAASETLPGSANGAAAVKVTSSGYPAVIVTIPSLDQADVLQPYMAQTATASSTITVLGTSGSNLVEASYGGDTTYAGSTSSTIALNQPSNVPIITWAAPASIVYGTPLSASQLNATANVPGTFVYLPAAGTEPGAGSQTLGVTFTPTDTRDYTIATASVTLLVTQATPVINWPAPAAIVYGTALSGTQLNASANVPGTFVYSPAPGAAPSAGSLTLSVTFAPTDTSDYTIATQTAKLTVNKAPLAVAANNASIIYGGNVPTLSGTLTGVVLGDGITAGYATTATSTSAVGPYPITATLNDPNGKLSNYTVTNTSGMLTIGQATPAITWATPPAITYGTALGAAQLNASAAVAGSFSYSPATGTVLKTGSQTLTAIFTPTDAVDYKITTTTATLTVNQAAPGIAWATPAPVTYGTALGATQLNATSTIAGAFSYSPAAGTLLTLGSHTITATFKPTDATDYSGATASVILAVNQATPAIAWPAPAAINYGTPLGAAQLNASSTVAGAFAYSPAAGTLLATGSQTLKATFTPTDSTDYGTATASTSLTVNQATPGLLLTASANSTFFSDPVTFTATLSPASGASSSAATPGGSVVFYDGTTQLGTATIAAGTASYTTSSLAAGAHSVTAVYSGDGNYVTLTSAGLNETVETFTVAPPAGGSTSATVSPGGQASYTLVFSPPSGSTLPAAINLTVTGLPAGATATFSPASIPSGAGQTTVTLTVAVPTTAAMQRQRSPFGLSQSLFVLGMIFLPFAVIRRKNLRRLISLTSIILFSLGAALLIAGVSGCGGGSGSTGGSGITPQTYNLTVTATSGTLSNTTALTLTVE